VATRLLGFLISLLISPSVVHSQILWTTPYPIDTTCKGLYFPAKMGTDSHGNIVVAWIERSDTAGQLVVERSTDNGGTWVRYVPIRGGFPRIRVHDIVCDYSGGTWLLWDSMEGEYSPVIYTISKSIDHGVTFQTFFVCQSAWDGSFYPRLQVDKTNSVYLLWDDYLLTLTTFPGGDPAKRRDLPIPVDTLVYGMMGSVAVDDIGGVFVFWRGVIMREFEYRGFVFCSASVDTGRTFVYTTRVDLNEIVFPGPSSSQIYPDAVGNADGSLAVTYQKANSGSMYNNGVFVARSVDRGVSFGVPVELPGQVSGGFPKIARDSVGDIHVVWAVGPKDTLYYARASEDDMLFHDFNRLGFGEGIVKIGRDRRILCSIYQRELVHFTSGSLLDPVPPDEEPGRFRLYPNHPNPFNNTTQITLETRIPTAVTITVTDIIGRTVEVRREENPTAGKRVFTWSGDRVASGIYLCRVRGETREGTQSFGTLRLCLVK
jgi:hypothetical protein